MPGGWGRKVGRGFMIIKRKDNEKVSILLTATYLHFECVMRGYTARYRTCLFK
jgi:hypothetical protein